MHPPHHRHPQLTNTPCSAQQLGPACCATNGNRDAPTGRWITYFTNWCFVGFGLQALMGMASSLQVSSLGGGGGGGEGA